MNELIVLSNHEKFKVNARDLHQKLEVKTRFDDWIRRRIKDFDSIQNVDFLKFEEALPGGGRSVEYYCTTGMGKELCVVENNDIGKRIRKQLVAFEEKYNKPMGQIALMRQSLDLLEQQQSQLSQYNNTLIEHKGKIENIEDNLEKEVKKALKKEQIHEFPQGCIDLDHIKKKYFKDISIEKIKQWLIYTKHPTREYKKLLEGNIIRLVLVYEEKGLNDSFIRLIQEATYIKSTPKGGPYKNKQYYHPALDNFRIKI